MMKVNWRGMMPTLIHEHEAAKDRYNAWGNSFIIT
jgi:hypothetical protein